MTAQEIFEGFKKVRDDRTVVESSWEDVYYYVLPRKRGITYQKTQGERAPADVYTSVGVQSNIILAAGLSGFLTNQSQRWFELGVRDRELVDDSDEKKYFSDVTDILFSTFAESNFYDQVHEMYLDFGPSGIGVLYEEEDPINDVRFYARHPREIFAVENEREIVDVVYRCFELTAYQAFNFFGDKAPEEVVKCVKEKNDLNKKFLFIHYVGPRAIRDTRKKDNLNKPYESKWIMEKDPKNILKESGYDEFPFFVPRFYKNSGEVYGYGPGHASYPDLRMLSLATKLYYDASEVSLFPPTIEEHDSIVGSLNMKARGRNYQKQSLSRGTAVQPLLTGANYQISLDFLDRLQEKIEKMFFVDLFLALRQTKRMTATEVMEISQERMFMLGPVLGRLQHEFLDKIIERTFNILLRRGKLPTIPKSLEGVNYQVKYISPLARAQRAMQARDMQAFMAVIGQMAQLAPSVLDKINPDIVVDELSDMYSVSPKIIYGKEEVEEKRAAQAQQMAQQQQMMAIQQGAQIAESAGKASKSFSEAQRTQE